MSQSLLTGLAVVALALCLTACQPSTTNTNLESAPVATATPLPSTPPDAADLTQFAPGSQVVSTTTTYQSPGGPEEVGFTLVVDESGIIVDATTTVLGKSPTTQFRQTSFSENLPAAIEGKKLADLGAIDRVGGSSLTTKAFNDSLADLQSQL